MVVVSTEKSVYDDRQGRCQWIPAANAETAAKAEADDKPETTEKSVEWTEKSLGAAEKPCTRTKKSTTPFVPAENADVTMSLIVVDPEPIGVHQVPGVAEKPMSTAEMPGAWTAKSVMFEVRPANCEEQDEQVEHNFEDSEAKMTFIMAHPNQPNLIKVNSVERCGVLLAEKPFGVPQPSDGAIHPNNEADFGQNILVVIMVESDNLKRSFQVKKILDRFFGQNSSS